MQPTQAERDTMSTITTTNCRAGERPTDYQIALARAFVKHLGTGRENAKTAAKIANEMGTTPRMIQQYAETARRCGFPVIAHSFNPPGYFLAQTAAEVRAYAGRLHHRFGEIAKTRREMLRNLKKWDFETQQHNDEKEG